MLSVTVSAKCMCCGEEGSFTTDPNSATDSKWVEEQVTTYCCFLESVYDVDTKHIEKHPDYNSQFEYVDEIPF